MIWPKRKIGNVAPAKQSNIALGPEDVVWHLTLDQIESNTGRIVNKKLGPFKEAGSSTFIFDEENVLYSKLRPYLNKVTAPNERGVATTELIPLRPHKNILTREFLTYYLRSKEFLNFANIAVAGVKMPRIIMAKFWQHKMPIPALSEQRRIVEILDQADDLRKKRAEADAKAGRILPALFYEMFGDQNLKPMGWNQKNLSKLLKNKKGALQSGPFGSHLHNHDFVENGKVLAVGIDNVHDNGFEIGRERRITIEKFNELKKFALEPNDVLITIMGTIGRTCVFPKWASPAICTKHVYRIQVNGDEVEPEYLSSAIKYASYIRGQLGITTTGQIVKGITSKALKSLTFDIPPIALQRKYVYFKSEFERARDITIKADKKTDLLFRSLLFRAFNGELTANWRKTHMKELLAEMEIQVKALN